MGTACHEEKFAPIACERISCNYPLKLPYLSLSTGHPPSSAPNRRLAHYPLFHSCNLAKLASICHGRSLPPPSGRQNDYALRRTSILASEHWIKALWPVKQCNPCWKKRAKHFLTIVIVWDKICVRGGGEYAFILRPRLKSLWPQTTNCKRLFVALFPKKEKMERNFFLSSS